MEVDSSGTNTVAVPDGWTYTVKQRAKGKTAGKFDCYIFE